MILNLYLFIFFFTFSLAKNVTGQLPMCMQLTFLNFNMLIFFLICNINLNATNVIQCDRNVGKLIIIILVFAKQFVVNKGVFLC